MSTKPKPTPVRAASLAVASPAPPELSPRLQSILQNIEPSLKSGALLLISADANDTGGDDVAGNLLLYGAAVIESVLWNEEIPPLPEKIAAGLAGRISGTGRYVVIAVTLGIGTLSAQLAGSHRQAATAFRYINQVLMGLLTTSIVPAAPAALSA